MTEKLATVFVQLVTTSVMAHLAIVDEVLTHFHNKAN